MPWHSFVQGAPVLGWQWLEMESLWEWIQSQTLHFCPEGEGAALALVRITEPQNPRAGGDLRDHLVQAYFTDWREFTQSHTIHSVAELRLAPRYFDSQARALSTIPFTGEKTEAQRGSILLAQPGTGQEGRKEEEREQGGLGQLPSCFPLKSVDGAMQWRPQPQVLGLGRLGNRGWVTAYQGLIQTSKGPLALPIKIRPSGPD